MPVLNSIVTIEVPVSVIAEEEMSDRQLAEKIMNAAYATMGKNPFEHEYRILWSDDHNVLGYGKPEGRDAVLSPEEIRDLPESREKPAFTI